MSSKYCTRLMLEFRHQSTHKEPHEEKRNKDHKRKDLMDSRILFIASCSTNMTTLAQENTSTKLQNMNNRQECHCCSSDLEKQTKKERNKREIVTVGT